MNSELLEFLLNCLSFMNAAAEDAIVVFITAADKDEAGRLAEMLVEARLAACVQVLPGIESIYRWQGKVERQGEVLLIAKTVRSSFEDLEREVRALHSYETPEIVAVSVESGSGPYLDWVRASVNTDAEQD